MSYGDIGKVISALEKVVRSASTYALDNGKGLLAGSGDEQLFIISNNELCDIVRSSCLEFLSELDGDE